MKKKEYLKETKPCLKNIIDNMESLFNNKYEFYVI